MLGKVQPSTVRPVDMLAGLNANEILHIDVSFTHLALIAIGYRLLPAHVTQFNIFLQDLFLSSSATLFRVPVDQNEAVGSRCDADIIDAVTATGVRMWSPEYKDWVEVTVRGNVCVPREHSRNSPGKVVSCRTNEIVSGSIVDLGGVYLLFQGAHQMKRQASAEAPHKMLFDINIQRPRCPVLFSTIAVQYTSDRDKLVNTYAKKFAMKLPGKVSSLDCKALDLSNGFGDSEIQSMSPHVFTSCGHVHAFSKELLGR